MGYGMAVSPQFGDQRADLGEGDLVGLKAAQLAADVDRHAAHIEPGQRGQPRIDSGGEIDRHAKLVFRLAGGNLFMRAGIDIRVDAQRAVGGQAAFGGEGRKFHALFLAFEVELADAFLKPLDHFPGLLAHAREDDVAGRHSRRQGTGHFPAGDDIRPQPFALHHSQHGEVRVGLDRESDVDARQDRQRLAENAGVAGQGGARIDIDGGADRIGDGGQGRILGMKHAVAVIEMVHR